MMEEVAYKPAIVADPSEAPAGPTVRQDTFDLVLVMSLLRRKLWPILGFTLAGTLLTLVWALLSKPYYTATASFVPPGSSASGLALAGNISQLAGLGGLLSAGKSPGDLYVGLMKSNTIQSAMIQHFGLIKRYGVKKESQAAKVLTRVTSASVDPKDAIVTISVTDNVPSFAADMANAYLEELERTTGHLALTESSQRRLFFENRLAQERDALAKAEADLKSSQERTGLIAPAGQTGAEIGAVTQLRAEITAHEVELASLLSHETNENPDVQRVRSELGTLQAQVQQMEKGKEGPSGGLSSAQVPALTLQYARLAREVKYHETLFDIIAKQYEAARLDEARDAPLQVIDRAMPPDAKSGPKRLTMVASGLFAGLFGSIAWYILSFRWKEMLARRRSNGLPV